MEKRGKEKRHGGRVVVLQVQYRQFQVALHCMTADSLTETTSRL